MKTLTLNPFVFHTKRGPEQNRLLIQSALNNEIIDINLIKFAILKWVILLMFPGFFSFLNQATLSPLDVQGRP